MAGHNATMTDEDLKRDAWWNDRCDVLYQSWVQLRYHRRRQRFFDLADKSTKTVTVVLGASLMGQYVRPYLPWLATAITAAGLLPLIFGYSDRKQAHKEIAEQYAGIIEAIEGTPVSDLTAQKLADWKARASRLIAKAPPPMRTLTIICEREQSIAQGQRDHIPNPHWLNRTLADFKS